MSGVRGKTGPEGRPGEQTVISGSIESVIYTNEENGYTVFRLSLQEGGIVTVVGTLPYAAPGEELTAEGQWMAHQVHGTQFRADHMERLLPASLAGIVQYLSSGIIKGVGPATARNIVEAFGEDALRIMEESPERLAEIKGIPAKRAEEIGAAFRKQAALRRLLEFFAGNDIRLSIGIRMYRSYGDDAMSVLYANPYILCDEYFGATFAESDRLALKLGFEGDCSERVEAAVLFELHQCRAPQGAQHLEVSTNNDEGPPVPIPNTEVKLISGDDTWLATARENSTALTQRSSCENAAASFLQIALYKR